MVLFSPRSIKIFAISRRAGSSSTWKIGIMKQCGAVRVDRACISFRFPEISIKVTSLRSHVHHADRRTGIAVGDFSLAGGMPDAP